jgi:UDP-N-acetylmuramyl pentapeptide phosphotransferase/UDP-N-acetylglucosamine-1-phosphate transferase
MINSWLCFSWAFLISIFAIPSIVSIAHRKQLLDEPNMRTIHMSLTPRLGGIAIFAGFASAITIFGDFTSEIQQIIAGCIILFFIGLKDDIVTVSPFKKFFVQILATGIVVFIGNIRITSFQGFLSVEELPLWVSYSFTYIMIIGITNAINLIDGLDGLAGSVTVLICMFFGTYFYLIGNNTGFIYANLAFCLAGSVVGFLRYNFKNAIVFMGDTGSLVIGFIVSIMAIKFIELRAIVHAPSAALAILIIPFFDTVRVLIIRILKRKSPFFPDKNHIHHIIKMTGLDSVKVVAVILVINLTFFGVTILLKPYSENIILTVLVCMMVFLSFILEFIKSKYKTNETI